MLPPVFPPRRSSKAATAAAGHVRIIGGRWRGRRLEVVDVAGLRPTGDRVRETVFNWLQPLIAGARCVDLFAGSGALGFEAASRGAASVTLIEPDARAWAALQRGVAMLDAADTVQLVRGTAEQYLAGCDASFDIAFIDPPFEIACQQATLDHLLAGNHLTEAACVHVEAPHPAGSEAIVPDGFEIFRERRFGDVDVRLLRHP